MHILGTDETNFQPSKKGKFFIYGGLVLPIANLPELDRRIQEARTEAGYTPTDVFKFDTRSRPDAVTIEAATEAKRETVLSCIELGAKFIACVVHHGILKNRSAVEQIGWSANHVIGRFNRYLLEQDTYGICLVDRLPMDRDYDYLAEKFSRGLDKSDGSYVGLNRISIFGSTCVGASHFVSAVDIVLGSFRYCVNEPINVAAAKEMFGNVASLMWGLQVGEDVYVGERGLILRPQTIRKKEYRDDYDQLVARLWDLL